MSKKQERNFNRRYASEYNIFRSIFYLCFLYTVVIPFFTIFYNYKITGTENLPKWNKKDKYIFTANHVSIFDPFLVPMAVKKLIAFMAKKELFEPQEKFSWLIKRLGAFAVDRTKPEIATFKTVRDIFKTSWSLGVFPQGGTRPYGKLEEIKKRYPTPELLYEAIKKDPELNIRIGVILFKAKYNAADGNLALALKNYNGSSIKEKYSKDVMGMIRQYA